MTPLGLLRRARLLAPLALLSWCCLARCAAAQDSAERPPGLPRDRFKSGSETLRAFAPIAAATRHSVVKLDVDGNTVALGAVIDARGLALTKASEIKPGRLTCWIAGGKEVAAEVLAVDEESDVALVKVHATGLKPVQWAVGEVVVGQWAITPGIEPTPQAVGIISVPPRKILHKRALIGVQLDFNASTARIAQLMPGFGAEKAGLKPGDVILAVNDTPVNSREELTATLRNYREGQTVKLRVQRDQEAFDAHVQMTAPRVETTGRGLDRQERMNRFGSELSERAEGFELALQHDTVLHAWQCGGPLVNLDGKAIGLNIARAGRVATYALPAMLVRQIADTLKVRAKASKEQIETSQPSPPPQEQ